MSIRILCKHLISLTLELYCIHLNVQDYNPGHIKGLPRESSRLFGQRHSASHFACHTTMTYKMDNNKRTLEGTIQCRYPEDIALDVPAEVGEEESSATVPSLQPCHKILSQAIMIGSLDIIYSRDIN